MKKIGIILSVFIITGVFIYTMSFISSRNTCTGIRIYECTALQKQQAAAQQATDTAQMAQQQTAQQLAQQQAAAKLAQQQAAAQQAAAARVNTTTRAS